MTSAAEATREPPQATRKRGLLRAIVADTWVRHGIGGTVSAVAMGAVWAVLPWADEPPPHWAVPAGAGAVLGGALYFAWALLYWGGVFDGVLPALRERRDAIRARADEDVEG